MKAAVFKEPGQPLVIETVPDPAPEPRQLIVKVGFCGICGSDLHSTRAGPAALPCDSILGHEFAGEVVAVGSDLRREWRGGERVCALPFLGCGSCAACLTGRPFECTNVRLTGFQVPGAFAEYVATGALETLRIPDSLALQDAALVEPLAVGLHSARIAGLQAGARVLVTGAGPIGLAVLLWARAIGARTVVMSEFSAERRALALRLGADAVIDPTQELGAQFADQAGGPPDMIFECVGAPGLLAQCVAAAPRRTRIIGVGVCEQPDTFVPYAALLKELEIRFAIAYTRDDFETTIAMLGSGRLDARALITQVVPLGEFPAAFEALRNPTQQCKVLAQIGAA
jgi:(R,R)-butanediol dehydrogenase/meso-butanediol dehydrogenase/diacetyl reductase